MTHYSRDILTMRLWAFLVTLAGIERSRYVIPGTERLLQFFRWTLTTLLGHHGANLPIAEVLEVRFLPCCLWLFALLHSAYVYILS